MVEIKRESPVRFRVYPTETEVRDNWTVALAYDDEGQGPWLVDLAHKTRWDLQEGLIDEQRPCDLDVPAEAGGCTMANDTLINRMNRTQASIYHLGATAPALPEISGYTDVTDASVFLALFGPRAFQVAEKLSAMDFMDPTRQAPFLVQGPFCHVPCQIVTLEKRADGGGGFLLTCSRGYADSMLHAILGAGAGIGLRPTGEKRFNTWLHGLQKS